MSENRAQQLFEEHRTAIFRRTDRIFAILMVVQYFAGIFAAFFISPRTWTGAEGAIHLHVRMAVTLGFAISSLPILFAVIWPGRAVTRHTIAVGQMLYSALLIHLTGGRLETHFHIFGSLAFLGFYRDWRVLVTASFVVAADHYLRGIYWPESVYGITSPSSLRWLEHAAWVLFEDLFLALATYQSIREMREIAGRRAAIEKLARERQLHVRQLQSKERELEQALQAKDAFLSICSHELRTPLTALKLEAQLMGHVKLPGADPPAQEKVKLFSAKISHQVDRLARLVQDMLDVSRIRHGKLDLRRESVDLGELVQNVVRNVSSDFVDCQISFHGDGEITGNWDAFRIEQVVTNLVSNACKYGAGKPIDITIAERGGIAAISVKDRGEGIAADNLEKIFARFERVTQNSGTTGLGLGLYISREIVEQHGGKIRIESKLGEGSVFTVELPLIPAATLRNEPGLLLPLPASQRSAERRDARISPADYLSR